MLRGWLIGTISACMLLVSGAAGGVSLGEARVQSFMMQPLRIEIDLGVEDLAAPEDLKLRLASRAVMERFGIEYDRLLPQLVFRMRRVSNGRWVVVASTRDPVREPFFSFALQATWSGGEIVREYSVLLDPPNLRANPATTTRRAAPQRPAADSYGPVQAGEMLWPIAKKLRPAGVSTRRMMMTLLQANPHAFRNGNINNLRAGATLRIPSAEEIAAYSEQKAKVDMAEQMAAWRRGAAPKAAAPRTPPEPQAVAEPAPSPQPPPVPQPPPSQPPATEETSERLEIVTGADDDSEPLRKELLLTLEQVEADRLRSEALRDRLEKLEGEMDYLQRLLVLKERQIATLQQIAVTKNALDQAQSPAAVETPASDSAPEPAAARPAAAGVAAPVAPVDGSLPPANDFERQLLIYAVVALTAIVVLLALLLLRRGGGSRAGDYTLADHPAVVASQRPYADQIRKFEQTADYGRAPPPPPKSRTNVPPPPPVVSRPSSDERRDISDDDLAAWARDLDDEPDVPAAPASRATASGTSDGRASGKHASGEPETASDLDLDIDIPSLILDIDEELHSSELSEKSSILELAQAYLEIGDLDGARELLEKVVAEGDDPTEIAQARVLLADLDTH